MKKFSLHIILLIILLSCFTITTFVYADSTISVYLDGTEIVFDEPPCAVNGRTLLPIRKVFEAAGAVVSWDSADKLSVISKSDTTVWISAEGNFMTVKKGSETYDSAFEVAPIVVNGRTLVPVKQVAEAFDIMVEWNGKTNSVLLFTDKPETKPNVIQITGFYPPEKTTVGSSYMMLGKISADGIIDRVNVKITDILRSDIEINETAFNIGEKSFYLTDIDKDIRFGTLSVGSKLMEITAVTENETKKTFSYNFEVVRPEGAKVNGDISMLWPVPDSGLITTIFWCDNPFCHSNAGRVNGHAAIDISAPENSDVIAVKDGIVLKTGFGDSENGYMGYGNFIVVDHGDGLLTQYSHLYTAYVAEGEEVSAGQVIGGVGNTGNSTGNHLDFNIEKDGERCDPLYYLQMHPDARCYEECDIPFFEEAMKKREE